MGLMDSIKNAFDGNDKNDSTHGDRAQDMAHQHEEGVSAGVDRAGDQMDERTDGRFEDQVNRGEDYIQDKTGNL